MKDIFTEKYLKNSWLGKESKSGPGSSLKNTYKILDALRTIIPKYNIKTIIDCGCGDFNWMKCFDFNSINYYLGVDIVEEAINDCKKYETDKIHFNVLDITGMPIEFADPQEIYETFDLAICKDVLFHLSYTDALKAIDNFRQNCKYLLATTFIGFKNYDIPTGNWRRINMSDEPFNLGDPIELIENVENQPKTPVIEKSMGLWKFN